MSKVTLWARPTWEIDRWVKEGVLNGFTPAAEIVNDKHPELGNLPLAATEGLPNLGGAKLELTFVDHQGNPSLAQQLATRLITQDKVHALLGAYQSSCSFTAT